MSSIILPPDAVFRAESERSLIRRDDAAAPTGTVAPFSTGLYGVNVYLDGVFQRALIFSLVVLVFLILVLRLTHRFRSHMRHMSAMHVSREKQTYFAMNESSWYWKIKRHIIYAPLWKKRHNREIRISSSLNMGTLPSRLQAIMLVAYFIANVAYCAVLDYSKLDKYSIVAELRGRSGVLSAANMVPLIVLAGRNNPLIPLLQISFDTYNLFHRWIGRMAVLEAIAHTICWAYVKQKAYDWSGVRQAIVDDPFISYGTVATVAMVFMALLSPSPIRHAFYETFLDIHILLAIVTIIGVWVHCQEAKLPQLLYVKAVVGMWVCERCFRIIRIVMCNFSRKGWTSATVEALSGDVSRVTLHLPNYVDIQPGTHAYLRFAGVKLWETHPFSIAWVDHVPRESVLPSMEKETGFPNSLVTSQCRTDVSFIIQAQTGFTRSLFNRAQLSSPHFAELRAAFEGPYAGHHSLDSYGHCVLFAGASGITHQISYIRHLVNGFSLGTVATRRITLVWVVRDAEHLEWVRPWMDHILRLPRRRDILQIKLFITRPKSPREVVSPSSTVGMYPGRPNIDLLLKHEVKEQIGAMAVTVCGPGGLADNVRNAVRASQHLGKIDLVEESFTW